MTKLTKRERVLLFCLLILVILAGSVYFLLVPTAELGDRMEAEIDANSLTYTEMQAASARLPALEQQLEAAYDALEAGEKRLQPALTNDELDALLTGMILDAGLVPESMELGEAGLGGLYAFGSDPEAEDAAAGMVWQNSLLLTAWGDLDGAAALIDAVAQNEAMLLTSWSAAQDDNAQGEGDYCVSVQLTVFMRLD